MNRWFCCFGVFALGMLSTVPQLVAQPIEVDLATQASFAADQYHVVPFLTTPSEDLVLPDLDGISFYYVEIQYPGLDGEDSIISGVLIDEEEAETLFIDKNNDEDLTNDGLPDFFPSMDAALAFTITVGGQEAQVELSRALAEEEHAFVTKKGDLNKDIVAAIQNRDPAFKGKRGTFLFASYPSVRRGRWQTPDEEFAVALYDANKNGSFNDEHDVFLIDLNADGRFSGEAPSEFYHLEDAILVQGQSFRLEQVYANGTRFVLRLVSQDSSY